MDLEGIAAFLQGLIEDGRRMNDGMDRKLFLTFLGKQFSVEVDGSFIIVSDLQDFNRQIAPLDMDGFRDFMTDEMALPPVPDKPVPPHILKKENGRRIAAWLGLAILTTVVFQGGQLLWLGAADDTSVRATVVRDQDRVTSLREEISGVYVTDFETDNEVLVVGTDGLVRFLLAENEDLRNLNAYLPIHTVAYQFAEGADGTFIFAESYDPIPVTGTTVQVEDLTYSRADPERVPVGELLGGPD